MGSHVIFMVNQWIQAKRYGDEDLAKEVEDWIVENVKDSRAFDILEIFEKKPISGVLNEVRTILEENGDLYTYSK